MLTASFPLQTSEANIERLKELYLQCGASLLLLHASGLC